VVISASRKQQVSSQFLCLKGYIEHIYNIGVLTVYIEFMRRGLETGERRAFSEFFHPFRAEPHKFYIYRQYTNIVFILQLMFI
jgi:hypothetical protein